MVGLLNSQVLGFFSSTWRVPPRAHRPSATYVASVWLFKRFENLNVQKAG